MALRVLVCGGRDYSDWQQLRHTLYDISVIHGISTIIHGGAWGADNMADVWAYENHIPVDVYHAEWHLYGRAAGPLRNKYMLGVSKPDLVVAFPGGKGTADMVRRAKAAGVPVKEVA